MKRWIIICFIISNILTTAFFNRIKAQQDSISLVRQRVFILQEYFNTNELAKKNILKIELARNYRLAVNYRLALKELNSIPLFQLNDSLREVFIYEKMLNNFYTEDYSKVVSLSNSQRFFALDSSLLKNIELISLLSQNYLFNFKLSEKSSLEYIKTFQKDLQKQDSLLNLVHILYQNQPRIKSRKKAKNLATFLPGSGMIYGGKFWEGIWSGMLQAGALSFAVVEFIQKDYITGYVAGLALLQKFYFGSIKHTDDIVKEKNNKSINEFNVQLTKILANI